MGKKAELSGVRAKGKDRIEFEFKFEGVRYRPTLQRAPSEANLRRAYKQLLDIKLRIKTGTFNFEEEFPITGTEMSYQRRTRGTRRRRIRARAIRSSTVSSLTASCACARMTWLYRP